jgi:hypothetical protein
VKASTVRWPSKGLMHLYLCSREQKGGQAIYLKEFKVKCPFQAHSEPNTHPSLTVLCALHGVMGIVLHGATSVAPHVVSQSQSLQCVVLWSCGCHHVALCHSDCHCTIWCYSCDHHCHGHDGRWLSHGRP